MIFEEIFQKYGKILSPNTEELIKLAYQNSSHKADLLLIHVHGFFNPDVHKANELYGYDDSPFVIGPGEIGHSENTHYDFISNYIKNPIYKYDGAYEEYLEKLEFDPDNPNKNDEIVKVEQWSVQLEMLIYLKIWESDLFIKTFYQLARLINGEHYDWHFQIAESNRSESKYKRHEVVRRYIRNRIRNYQKVYYEFFSTCYSNQIRNAIAHSKYALMSRNIHLHNYIEEDPYSQKRNLPFDEWTEIFHKSLVIYNEYAKLNHMISTFFQNYVELNNNTFDVRILTLTGEEKSHFVEYRHQWNDWVYKR